MKSLYPNSGNTIKRIIRVLNIVGYAVSDIIGLCVGAATVILMRYLGVDNGFLLAIGGVGAAGVVAGLLIFSVWFSGLLMWSYSDVVEDVKKIQREVAVKEPV